jgi:drug/metabolite transporter (DMT)-like permease
MTPAVGLALAGTVLLWASLFVATRAALPSYGLGHLMLLRFACTSATLAAVAVVSRPRRPTLRDLPILAASGLLGITLCNVGMTFGTRTVTASAGAVRLGVRTVTDSGLASRQLPVPDTRAGGYPGLGVSG